MLNNAALQEAIDTYGERIFCILMNNDRKIMLGYKDSPKLTDIELLTIGGVDCFAINCKCDASRPSVKYQSVYLTEYIENFGIMSEKDVDYRVDPFTYR